MPTKRTPTARPQPIRERRAAAKRSASLAPSVLAAPVATLLAVLALVASLLLAASASATVVPPSWSAPAGVSTAGAVAYEPHLAVDAKGDAAAIWMHGDGSGGYGTQVATRVAGGAWGAPVTLTGPGVHTADTTIAIDAKGDAVAVWEQDVGVELVEVATHAAGAPDWSGATTVSNPMREADDAQVAIDPKGDAIVAWTGEDAAGEKIVQASAEQGFGGEWGAPIALSAAGADAEELGLAMDAAGDAFAVWRRPTQTNVEIQEAQRPAGEAWGLATVLSPSTQNAIAPALAVDAKGDVAVIWDHFTDVNIAQVTTRQAGGGWSTPRDLTGEGENVFGQQVGLDAQGDVTAIWLETVGEPAVRSATEAAGTGVWSTPVDVAPPAPGQFEPSLAVDPAGDAVVAWEAVAAGQETVEAAARKGKAGGWSAPAAISAPGVAARAAEVGIEADGSALALWRDAGNGERISSSDYDPGTETPDEAPAGGGPTGGGPASGAEPSTPAAGSSTGSASEAPSNGAASTGPTASPTSTGPTAATPPTPPVCPAGKALRKVRVRVLAEHSAHGRKAKPRFKTVARCVKPAAAHKQRHAKHDKEGK
jgi:hypothetical protein